MQTHFTDAQLAQPDIAQADDILRKCVHCGFCTATCPTFVLTGDERDSPRGRIWMMRDMLEGSEIDVQKVGHHLDRCLTCLSCMTTCPSGVDYMHLVDIGRKHVAETTARPFADLLIRKILALTVPVAGRFHIALKIASLSKFLAPLMPPRMRAMVTLAPAKVGNLDPVGATDAVYTAAHQHKKPIKRVMLLAGCAQRAIDPDINAATLRLLKRLGIEVLVRQRASCCGALAHHIDAHDAAHQQICATIDAWRFEVESGTIDAIIVNTSGCGTTLKDYGNLMRDNAEYADIAVKISALACDVTELLDSVEMGQSVAPRGLSVAYHSACSMQHGQKITELPKQLLSRAGFEIKAIANAHLCCGSAGVYNVLQPDLSQGLKERKIVSINKAGADIVAAGNLGCINQLADVDAPICHTVQLLDWAYGGPAPTQLNKILNQG